MKDSGQEESKDEWSWEASLKAAILIGIPISEYNDMTPYELNVALEVYADRKHAEMQEQITYVWLGEYYHRLKKLEPIKNILEKMNKDKNKNMTDEEMLDMVKYLNAQFGGTVESGEDDRTSKSDTEGRG
jgi:hypothetical protein